MQNWQMCQYILYWDEKRKLCYDKNCSDYSNQYDCNQISFCSWLKYKCIDNGNQKLSYSDEEQDQQQ
ncbi:unnamed protein product [Paramecium octaurelia]|uniref:Uncharacterized protein n=1 Tax=Paramecium octaurelia TaxID=43137 RepID=A0A8S1YPZ1_PAROT|nr:unnamed protein product [Paramecium octaurelia]